MPGRNLCSFLIPPVAGAAFLAALFAKCLRGALAPVCLRAVYLVRAIWLCVSKFGNFRRHKTEIANLAFSE